MKSAYDSVHSLILITAWSLGVALAPAGPGVAAVGAEPAAPGFDRQSLEQDLPARASAFQAAPADAAARRAYADMLFKLGDVQRAREIMAPLATSQSSDPRDLKLGGTIDYFLGDYVGAERLFQRMADVSRPGSADHRDAIEGLILVHYQTNQYAKAKTLTLPKSEGAGEDDEDLSDLLTFMQRFDGQPYQISWEGSDKVARLPIVNDFAPAGALPVMRLEINGHPVEFILDTGGDRLYIDEGVAARVGIRTISHRKSRYAYTQGKTVDEPLGVADSVRLGGVTLGNVPVIVAKWKAMGVESDGVITTQILKQFLSTVDYDRKELVFRERSETGRRQFLISQDDADPISVPFVMAGTHLMFAKGRLNDRKNLNILLDSGLAASVPLVLVDETVTMLGLTRTPVPGQKFYTVPIRSHGIGDLIRGPTDALGNVFVEEGFHWRNGILLDALISHQYLRHLGSWTFDFDTMRYHFPRQPGSVAAD
ncbi:retropepsin-like aspartic protease [Sphingosinicella rhizophila]|uniref:Retropepsin-like aspartic protease n=1 Tax=Sphingosinicella rhizophila TaxID=3050082 RepID=A0ABU3Q9B3_9SPHN|nr:retropepsin-like aspartic protease [Sphingosinicella sp. GR2756]MDT9599996.1 retropepsin-like aspartic protease [Sphingosinicella sp. GR2756]